MESCVSTFKRTPSKNPCCHFSFSNIPINRIGENFTYRLSFIKSNMSVAAFSGSFEFLGSKISLITETKIRYEGILYRVDTQECTLSLSGGMSRL